MNRRERNEWIERAKERVLDNVMDTEHYVKDVMFLYDEVAFDLETEINAMFQKFAKDNILTESEANKLLSGEEYRHWKKGIDEYVKEAKGNSKTLLELNVLSAKSRISRKEKLLADVYQKMIDLSKDTETKLTDILGNVFKTNYYRSFHDLQSVMKVGFNVGKIDERTVKKILEKPWEGKRFSSRVWKNTDKLAAVARWEIGRGFTAGHSVQKMTKAIKDVMESGKYVTERLVRTEASRFANQGGAEAYKELGIEKYEVLGGGCGDCQEMNTQTFRFDEAIEGDTMPPFHPNCKCSIRADVDRNLFEKREGAESLEHNMKFKEWKEKYVDENEEKHYNEIKKVSGGITDINSKKAVDHAELRYVAIRKQKDDVKKIARNTGYSNEEIQGIKSYLFLDEHDLGGRIARFDPNFAIAQSWDRLESGNIKKHDLTLLKHEIMEQQLMRDGMTQDEAHKVTSKKYNYRKEADEYYAELEKRKKRR